MIPKFVYPAAVLALLLPAAFFLAGCKKAEAPLAGPPAVEVVAVEQQDVPVFVDMVGTLEAEVNATISAQVGGYLLSQEYQEGSRVTNGQVLFRIADRTYKAALDQAEANEIKAAQDVERYKPLAKTQAISQQELDDAVQANAAAAAATELARLNYQFCKILSPVDGVAGLAQAQVGNLVGPSSGPLTTVTKVDPIRVYFSIAQQTMTKLMEKRLAEGKEIGEDTGDAPSLELILTDGTVYSLKGKYRFSDNQVDVKTGTIRAVGEFANPQRLLVPGMFVRVRAKLGVNKNALLVPQRAVADMQGRKLIAVVDAENKVGIRPVQAGAQVGALQVIQGTVKPGDRVVAEGIQKVRDGAVVNPVPYKAAAAAGKQP